MSIINASYHRYNGPDQWLATPGLSTPLGFIASPLHRVVIPTRLADRWVVTRGVRQSDHRVVVLCANEAPLSPAFRIIINVVDDAWVKADAGSNRVQIDKASKVDPLAAVSGPRVASKRRGDPKGCQFGLELEKVFAHVG